MVALAYELAYRLRFDAGIPHRYQLLLNRTIVWTVVASMVIFVLFRLYQKWWRYVTGRDYVAIAQAIVVATLSLPAFVATTHPVKVRSDQGFTTVNIPLGVLVLFFLLTLTMVAGSRFAARLLHDPRARGFRPRKDARRILIVGAGDGGRLVAARDRAQPGPRRSTRSASSTTTRACAASASTASASWAARTTCRGSSTRPSPTR